MLATSDPSGIELAFDITAWAAAIGGASACAIRVIRRRLTRRQREAPAAREWAAAPLDERTAGAKDSRGKHVAATDACEAGVAGDSSVSSSPRYPASTFEPLARYLDHSRRLAVTEAKVAEVLAALPRERWLVERYVLRAGHRIPFLVIGETGVFAIWTIPGPPPWHEPAQLSSVAARVKELLPAYPCPVHVGICRALAPDVQPRVWHLGDVPGSAWIMGLNWLIPWLGQFGREHGLGAADIAQLREMAGPHWDRPTHPNAPAGIPAFDAR